MVRDLRIEPLAQHRDALSTLATWFEREWPSYYGPAGPGDARADLEAYGNTDGLPIGVAAFIGNELCGVAALKADSIASHAHLGPWAAAGLVAPRHRKHGIGAALVGALESLAARLGYRRIYCATNSANRLLERRGWHVLERAESDGERVDVYVKDLQEMGYVPIKK